MASTNQTAHYALPLYSGSDRATWTDTNTPFEDVDTALYGAVQDIGQAESQILNLRVEMGELHVSVSSMSADVEILKTDLAKENLLVLENKTNIEALQADLVDLNEDTIGASVEETMEATKGYSAGDWISVNNALYVATATISSGDALVVGTNVATKTLKEGNDRIDLPITVSQSITWHDSLKAWKDNGTIFVNGAFVVGTAIPSTDVAFTISGITNTARVDIPAVNFNGGAVGLNANDPNNLGAFQPTSQLEAGSYVVNGCFEA